MIDYSMLQEFTTEAGEHLDEMETDLLQLEANPENREILNDIFREIHSIKGAAEYVGLEKISELSHKLENLLEALRQGEIKINDKIVDTLIHARDRLALLNKELESSRAEESEIDDIVERVDRFSGGGGDAEKSKDAVGRDSGTENADSPEEEQSFEDVVDSDREPETSGADKPDFPDSGPDSLANENSEVEADENYEEEYDSELFEIFLQQLLENVSRIQENIEKLNRSQKTDSLLVEISNCVESLRSSANYMGYDRLVEIYSAWEKKIQEAGENVSEGKRPSFRFMDDYMSMLVVRFPQLEKTVGEAVEALKGWSEPECEEPSSGLEEGVREDDRKEDDFLEAVEKELDFLNEKESDGDAQEVRPVVRDPEHDPEPDPEHDPEESSAPGAPPFEQVDLSDLEIFLDDSKLYDQLDKAFDSALNDSVEQARRRSVEEDLFSGSEPNFQSLPSPEALEAEIEEEMAEIEEEEAKVEEEEAEVEEEGAEIEEEGAEQESATFQNEEMVVKDETELVPRNIMERRKADVFGDRMVKQTLRVDSRKIDALMNQVGELVVSRAWFSQLFNEMRDFQQYLKESRLMDKREMKQVRGLTFRLSEATVNLGRVANELQESIMKVRMLPISHLFNRYPRLVRDLVKDENKQVRLRVKGEDTELDKMMIEEISDPLVHIIRNAVDHGIETVEERRAKNKPDVGTIALEAYHESNHVVVEVSDDGSGIDPELVKAKALERGFVNEEEIRQMSPKEIVALIAKPGFSTKTHVTRTSGRGVGMDVVKKNVEKLNGSLEIDSVPGKQSRFRIKIPLTLAIIPALLVRVGSDLFTIPLANVEETLRILSSETTTIEGVEVVHLRDSTLPLVRLSEIFGRGSLVADESRAFVVVVSTGMRRVGLVVDALIGQEEVVIKPLVDYLQESSGFSGATILGDGRISLILDVYELVNLTIDRRTRKLAANSFFAGSAEKTRAERSRNAQPPKPTDKPTLCVLNDAR